MKLIAMIAATIMAVVLLRDMPWPADVIWRRVWRSWRRMWNATERPNRKHRDGSK